MHEANVVLQTDELQEACELFRDWAGRSHLLPQAVRDQLAAVSSEDIYEVRRVSGPVCEVVLTPRARALVGNLRARSPAPAYPGLKL